MIRTSARLKTLLAATALLGGAMAVNCSKSTDSTGVVKLALVVPPNYTVNTVHWQIFSATSVSLKQGDINTSDINSTASVDTSVAPGSGDTVTMTATATSPGGSVSCTGSGGPFNVTAGGSVMVGVTLVCGGSAGTPGPGSVIVNGMIIAGDNCPVLTNWEASPLQTTSGQPINVTGTATDADVGQTLTYAWTADSGSFVAPAAATTTYTCGSPGAHTLTLTVHDSYTSAALPMGCSTNITFPVNCVAAGICGNGTVEPGETCDPPNGTNCSATCQHVVFCGDGIVEGTEFCDPPSAATHCSATCQHIPFCGDGHVDPGEQCDPPNGGSCSATCQNVTVCPPQTACEMCLAADTLDCPPSLVNVPGAGCFSCNGFTGTAAANCSALLLCIRTQHCADAVGNPLPCYCGALSAGNCQTMGAPANAPCATQYAAAAVGFPGSVFTQFNSNVSPVGIANNTSQCDSATGCTCP